MGADFSSIEVSAPLSQSELLRGLPPPRERPEIEDVRVGSEAAQSEKPIGMG